MSVTANAAKNELTHFAREFDCFANGLGAAF